MQVPVKGEWIGFGHGHQPHGTRDMKHAGIVELSTALRLQCAEPQPFDGGAVRCKRHTRVGRGAGGDG